eukprot:TRINITY_DN12934_c0_g1_i1.p1 TRINITY_DN12934_c0_g1~~TRINITY_DN12934_c0_g1_i1.p1  ORF type:complete len:828 (-),score=227.51 TRINITY_DN12934_c0_g1_i1:82-2565(-)
MLPMSAVAAHQAWESTGGSGGEACADVTPVLRLALRDVLLPELETLKSALSAQLRAMHEDLANRLPSVQAKPLGGGGPAVAAVGSIRGGGGGGGANCEGQQAMLLAPAPRLRVAASSPSLEGFKSSTRPTRAVRTYVLDQAERDYDVEPARERRKASKDQDGMQRRNSAARSPQRRTSLQSATRLFTGGRTSLLLAAKVPVAAQLESQPLPPPGPMLLTSRQGIAPGKAADIASQNTPVSVESFACPGTVAPTSSQALPPEDSAAEGKNADDAESASNRGDESLPATPRVLTGRTSPQRGSLLLSQSKSMIVGSQRSRSVRRASSSPMGSRATLDMRALAANMRGRGFSTMNPRGDCEVAGESAEQGEIETAVKKSMFFSRESLSDFFYRLVESSYFQLATGLLVVLNAFLIAAQANVLAISPHEEPPSVFFTLELCFGIAFTLELVCRIVAHGMSFWTDRRQRGWNIAESFLVAMQLVEVFGTYVLPNEKAQAGGNLQFLRLLRMLRLVRIVRLARIVRFISELRTIVSSIAGSMKSLSWTLVLISLIIFVCGVWVTQLVADYRGQVEVPTELEEDFVAYYGSLFRSVLTLFQAITGGVNWDETVGPVLQAGGPLGGLLFVMYIAFSILAMLNVVTGVFVEAALNHAKADKEVQCVNDLRDIFMKCDTDNTGMIDLLHFERVMQDPEMEEILKLIDVAPSEARWLFELIDVDESGAISREEFILGCMRLKGGAKAIDVATLVYDNKRLAQLVMGLAGAASVCDGEESADWNWEDEEECRDVSYDSADFEQEAPDAGALLARPLAATATTAAVDNCGATDAAKNLRL